MFTFLFRRIKNNEKILKEFSNCVRFVSSKDKLKHYVFPSISQDDCEMKFISGWGPGGQKVNTAQNAVFLKHKSTGIFVKVHESRLLPKNIEIAFERLKHELDRHLNGENCYAEQLKRLEIKREERNKRQREKRRNLKKMETI
ncbi:Probable peptide chain release factor C12orf65, mitochondrial [Strongyloides ratti]|uniref:Probable peptide chain release factor C12orf65, mitochondrial n=1 Tax=Strongyloides ratti TaxID=34506 RepID=A0A090L9K0_STRRB|nr:Probable peptide chain release factor C12orf65, mitochondrial [Strongyloides ratti]CEF66466.1 Probable peptide chain release factor C12orf65, mitochondrial [Strongyloides ratti]